VAFNIFIDGEAGTTGLLIHSRLQQRADLAVISLAPALRKDRAARADALNRADAVILCLPDEAAREAVSLITAPHVRVIDASTAHRVAPGWTYGFPEMDRGQRGAIAASKRVSNPGCYSTAAIALLRPVVAAGLVPREFPATIHAVSGYTGGGKALIAEFQARDATPASAPDTFRVYGLSLAHKHVPEIETYSGLAHTPILAPSIGRYAQGMLLEIPLQLWALPGAVTPNTLRAALADAYAGSRFVTVAGESETAILQQQAATAAGYVAALDPESLNGTNRMKLFVAGDVNRRQARLIAILDNLGKGASGAAVQNLNIMLGLDEGVGLKE
jgi:N-acetyl-gamma-glutamyl-phosphate reductase